ncbi:Zn-dependent protease (includes SpoIVFB) [Methanococcoides vulcani]|uniref:Zinc metalloprotease n=1 Tax=Methanococcoides vulcani TaxID=1353158 RepID=A0A1I0AUJ1_9EURY|nr:CBS domain-containing protein [Methanococcoides vulcani]SES97851.1 Zn-dependent protease (includes SpoIVFB) [Methanococcoides vulcani]
MANSFKIGTIIGIPIKIHITFLLVLPFFTLVFAMNPAPYGFSDVVPVVLRYALSFLTTILLFGCVLLHELGHSYLAKKYGVKITDITLFLIGGVSSMEEIPRDPKQEAKMAFAGPLVSFIIGGSLLLLNFAVAGAVASFADSVIFRLVQMLGAINIVLGMFNLLPAFPMDGGRILRAWFARKMPYIQATHAAAAVGKMFAFLLGMLGLLSNPWNPWLILIAIFVYMGASGEDRSTAVTVTLEKVPVSEVMTKDIVSVEPSLTIDDLTQFMFEKKHMGYPVIEHNTLKGIITFTDVRKVMPLDRYSVLVSDVMTKDIVTIPKEATAADAFKLMVSNNIGRVLVVNENGSVSGILSRTDLMHTMMLLNE